MYMKNITINEKIAKLRKESKLTQAQLADIVGVSFQTISKWENGSAMPDITYLPALIKVWLQKLSTEQEL